MRVGKVRRSVQRFVDYANDLLRSDDGTFDDRLNLLIHFCSTDPLMSHLHEQMLNHPRIDIAAWHKEVVEPSRRVIGNAQLTFPTDIDERMSLMYQLLYKINNKEVDFFNFCIDCFSDQYGNTDTRIHSFNQAVSEPLFRELGYRLEDLDEELPDDTMADVNPATFQIIHYAENVIQQNANGGNISQSANIQIDSNIASLLQDLKNEINNATTGEDQEKALEAVESLQELAVEPKKNSKTIGFILKTLPPLGNIAGIASAIMTALGG